MDNFFRLVEARINRFFRTQKMSFRATTLLNSSQYIYSKPADYLSIRSIKLRSITEDIGKGKPLSLVTNEQFTNLKENGSTTPIYCVNGDNFYISPALDNYFLEVEYFGSITPLSDSNLTNWVSEQHPDCYLFGLVTEINAFVKDANAAMAWGDRFNGVLQEIKNFDNQSAYSGNPLQMRVG